jgi:hypothetical protein
MSNPTERARVSARIDPPSAGVRWESLLRFIRTILTCEVDDARAIKPFIVVLRREWSHR